MTVPGGTPGPGCPGGPCGPADPCGPCGPCEPCGPCGPTAPGAPWGPWGPCAPVGPGGPAGPAPPDGNWTVRLIVRNAKIPLLSVASNVYELIPRLARPNGPSVMELPATRTDSPLNQSKESGVRFVGL